MKIPVRFVTRLQNQLVAAAAITSILQIPTTQRTG